jgi:molecular chaperone GrpE
MTTNPEKLQEEAQPLTEETANQTENEQQEPQIETVSETERLSLELAEMKDRYLRLYADFDNFRRRTAKEKVEMIQSASESVIKAMLPLWDDMDRAASTFAHAEDGKTDAEGINLIFNKFRHILTTQGVKPMEAKGQSFDTDLHECITQFAAPSEDLKGKVIDEVEKGYYLHEKVIRFAKVVVGS